MDRFQKDPIIIYQGQREDHMQNFIDCIQTRHKPHMDALSGYKVMAAVGMGIESFRRRKTLYFDSDRKIVIENPKVKLSSTS